MNPGVERSAKTDIFMGKPTYTIGIFQNFEMGAVSFFWDFHGSRELGTKTTVGVKYLFAYKSIFKTLKK